jgi:hypothetical protein
MTIGSFETTTAFSETGDTSKRRTIAVPGIPPENGRTSSVARDILHRA